MHRINPRKLYHSKWTAVNPVQREKHFLVSDVEFNEEGSVVSCTLEAIISKREFMIDWVALKNTHKWIQGWK
ncbi:TIGR02450 family Trp-rich protein [Vibrio sp. FNV 38]|nr:TIGR02450 family Trp-rich protein [Vibrio sp. FNV 38]